MIFGNKMEVCKWHKCDIGYRYHHTLEEWDTHASYGKVDIPRIDEETSSVSEDYYTNECVTSTSTVQSSITITDETWKKVAIGTFITVWGIVIFLATRALI